MEMHNYVATVEEEMANHSSIFAWRIPWTEKPVGLQSMGWQRVGQGLVTNAHMQRRGGFYFHY